MMSFGLLCLLALLGGPIKGMAEVHNVALRGKATQSRMYFASSPFGQASFAIDGNRDPIYDHGSCSHTVGHHNPWWRVDLLRSYKVQSVAITNRGDCCAERLNGAEIRIGNSLLSDGNANPLCATISSIPAGNTRKFNCKGMAGRWVNIVIPGRAEYLQLCEVEVYADFEEII